MLNVIMVSVAMLSVVAPDLGPLRSYNLSHKYKTCPKMLFHVNKHFISASNNEKSFGHCQLGGIPSGVIVMKLFFRFPTYDEKY